VMIGCPNNEVAKPDLSDSESIC